MPSLKYYDRTVLDYKYLVGGLSQETADARYLMSGFRNVIRNGDMSIAQRGTSISYTGDSYKYCLDGWLVWNETPGAGTTTISQVAQADGPSLMQIVISGHTGTDKSSTLYQKIEDVRTLNGRPVTVSFVAKALTGAPKIYVGFGQYFGSGGSAGVSVPGQEVTISTVLTRYSVTLTLPSTAGKTIGAGSNLELYIGLSEGRSFGNQNNTFSLTDVQLEEGSVATPFERLPVQQQLAWCQRYFWRLAPGNAGQGTIAQVSLANQVALHLSYVVPMRATPTFNVSDASHWAASVGNMSTATPGTVMGVWNASPVTARIYLTVNASTLVIGNASLVVAQNASAAIDFSAELL